MSTPLPMTQEQGIIAGVLLTLLVIIVNVVNGVVLHYQLNKSNEELSEKLAEISKELLVKSGYLKDKDNGQE